MALHTPNTGNTNTNTGNTGTTNQGNSSPYRTPTFGLSNQMSGMGSGGEYFERLYAKLQACVKLENEQSGSTSKYGIQKLLKSPAGLRYSGIILTERVEDIVSAHVLVVERTGTYPEVLIENYNGTRYEINRTPGEALDVKYMDQVGAAIANVMKVPAKNIIIADGTLVPSEFDVESEVLIAELFNNAYSAIKVEIQSRVFNYRGNDITQIVRENPQGKFIINLHFNSEESVYLDQTGMPVRQDICVDLSFKSNTSQNTTRSINQGDDVKEIVRTYGYIDFEYVGPTVMNGIVSTQKFMPNFIITHIEAPLLAQTPDIVMLAVASVLSINEDMAWTQAFRPTPARKNEVDLNDIGALNIDGNIEQNPTGYGKKWDSKSKSQNTMELNKFIQTLVKPVLLVSVDVPKAGPETWFMAIFQAIMSQNKEDAYNRIMTFMTHATGGAYVPDKTPMFDPIVNKIHGGFYKSKEGFRDLRNLSSYLAVANHVNETGQQPAVLTQYTNTLYSNLPTVLRASARKAYIDDMSNRNANIKQMFDRLTFNGTFLTGWINTLRNVGFTPVFSSGGAVNDMFIRRSTANFQSAVMQQDVRLMSQQNAMPGTWGQYGSYNRQY